MLAILLMHMALGNPSHAQSAFDFPRSGNDVVYLILDGSEDPSIRDLGQRALDGDTDAMSELADRYVAGDGLPRDLAAARIWYTALARAGDARAAFNVGALLERSTDPDALPRAAVAYAIALDGGIDEAADRLAALAQTTAANPSTDDIEALQTRLSELGFDAGPADGLIGPRTREALAAWLEAAGLPSAYPPGSATRALAEAWHPGDTPED